MADEICQAAAPDFQSRLKHGTWQAVNHHRDGGSDNDSCDPAEWQKASYSAHPVDSMEPLSDEPNPYRQAALHHLGLMYSVDQFLTEAKDARFAVIVVAIALGWPSTRGWTVPEIADQMGVSVLTITRACARFKTMAGLNSAGELRPGAGSLNGAKAGGYRTVKLSPSKS